MSLRARVLGSMAGLLVLTVAAAWMVAGGGVLRPLLGELRQGRVEQVEHIVDELAASPDPHARAVALSDDLGVEVELVQRRPHLGRGARRHTPLGPPGSHAGGLVEMDDGSTVAVVPLGRGRRELVTVHFPVDLARPGRRIALGLAVLLLAVVLAAWVSTRWVLRPLEVASDAMQRVAAGELEHRVPDGSDVAGQIGGTFNQMAERVEALVRGQRQLMAAVSHELRTPLARLRLHTEMLRDAGADAARLDKMEADIGAVDALVEELLESARLDQGVLALRLEDLPVDELAAEALGAVDLGEHPVHLEVPDGLVLHGDRRRLVRALANLLTNVRRYTPPEAEVSLRAHRAGQEVHLVVADRGPGVAPDSLEQLFDPFFREEGSRSRATGGLGLGLMLVRQIAEAHGGRAVARSRDGGGLEVSLILP